MSRDRTRRGERGRAAMWAWSLALVCVVAGLGPVSPATAGTTIDPGMYDELASGVGRVVVRACDGSLRSQGTGFLVGTKVVMTAHHVLDDRRACDVRVQIGGRTYVGERWTSWYKGSPRSEDDVDVSTIKLTTHADGHVFEFARVHPRPRDTIAMIGHSAANPLSLSQGKFLSTKTIKGIPTLAVFLQAARGASGSPLINERGTVVGVLQKGVADIDGGVVLGIDLVRERGLPRALCKAYPSGGIAGCGTSPAKPATGAKPAPKPKPAPLRPDLPRQALPRRRRDPAGRLRPTPGPRGRRSRPAAPTRSASLEARSTRSTEPSSSRACSRRPTCARPGCAARSS